MIVMSGALDAVDAFVKHVEEYPVKTDGIPNQYPLEIKERRKSLIDNMVVAFGATKDTFVDGIERTTLDRWVEKNDPRESVLRRLEAKAKEFDEGLSQVKPTQSLQQDSQQAIHFLSSEPRSWGQLKLALGLFNWHDAIFKFDKPFNDDATVIEIAKLALSGTRIIYITPHPDDWIKHFKCSLVFIFGQNKAAAILSRICIIAKTNDSPLMSSQFGILNFQSNGDDCIGYRVVSSTDSKNAHDDSSVKERDADFYHIFSSGDDIVNELRDDFEDPIAMAMGKIDKEAIPDKFKPSPLERRKFLDTYRIIQFKNGGWCVEEVDMKIT